MSGRLTAAGCEFVPPRPIEMVAVDLDGTLLRSARELSVRVIRAVHRVHRHGVRVVLASARPPRSVREIYEHLKLDTWQINYNGALIYDPVNRRNVRHQPLAPMLIKRLVKAARKTDPEVVVSIEILDKWYTDHVDESLPTETSKHFSPDFIGPLEAFWHVPATKLMLLAPPERMDRVTSVIARRFGDKVSVTRSDKHMIQIAAFGVDKAPALQEIATHYRIDPQAVLAIGDAPNDVGMLRWAGVGAAVRNAWPEALAAADVVVGPNDEDGVAEALDRFVLQRDRSTSPAA